MSKLSDIVKNNVVKKAVYDKLAAKVNNMDTSEFVFQTKYETEQVELEKKIPDVTDFVKKTNLTELENKIPDVSSLARKAALTAVENKIPSVSRLVEKTNYDTKRQILMLKCQFLREILPQINEIIYLLKISWNS